MSNLPMYDYIDPKTTKVDINRKNQTMLEFIQEFFRSIIRQFYNFPDAQVVNYYKNFFQTFTPAKISEIKCFSPNEVKQISENYQNQVVNKATMINYLKNTPGIYTSICLWAEENPYIKDYSHHIHHVFPKFLVGKYYNFSTEKILVSYNEIKVDWFIHSLLDGIRLFEYAQPEDNQSVKILICTNSDRNIKLFDPRNRLTSIMNIFKTVYLDPIWKNYPDYDQTMREHTTKAGRASGVKHLSGNSTAILEKDTIWVHPIYKTISDAPLIITISGQKKNPEFLLQEFCLKLLSALPEKCPSRQYHLDGLDTAIHLFRLYVNGRQNQQTLFGWVLANRDISFPILDHSLPGEKSTRGIGKKKLETYETTALLIAGHFVLKNVIDPSIKKIVVKPHQFYEMNRLIDHVMFVSNKNKKSPEVLTENKKEKFRSYFGRWLRGISTDQNKIGGW